MDYIREELLRQQSALRLLMGSSEKSDQSAGAEAGGTVKEEPVWAESSGLAEQVRSAARLSSRFGMGGGTDGAAPGFIPEEFGGTAQGRQSGTPAEQVSAGQLFRLRTAPMTGSPAERTVTELLWAGGGATLEPRELSRIFQRDARRYDGAFSADGKGE